MQQPSTYPYDAADPFGSMAGGRKYPHTGSDWTAPTGSPVFAIADGTINAVGETSYNGKYIQQSIEGYNLNAAYLHLSRQSVPDGREVTQGDIIGYSGNTGSNSRGPHLHVTISDGKAYDGLGNKIDPHQFIIDHPNGPQPTKGKSNMFRTFADPNLNAAYLLNMETGKYTQIENAGDMEVIARIVNSSGDVGKMFTAQVDIFAKYAARVR